MMYLELSKVSLTIAGRTLIKNADLILHPGEVLAIMGPSGSGKTSLLNCVAGMLRPDSGTVRLNGTDIYSLSDDNRTKLRLTDIGMVFQFGELLPELTTLENVSLPLRFAGVAGKEAGNRARALLIDVGLEARMDARPEKLSGGEIQRAGIARALVSQPELVLADEPTGMLDETNARLIVKELIHQARAMESAVLIVTHDTDVASAADRVLRLRDACLMPESETLVEVAV